MHFLGANRTLLHAVLPSGGKIYQDGFATFCNTHVKVHDLEVCFIASLKLWRGIQIDMFVENCNTKTRIL